MISVGVDVSKGKSTVCILKPYGEVVSSPFEIHHVEKDMEDLDNLLEQACGRGKDSDGGHWYLPSARSDISS